VMYGDAVAASQCAQTAQPFAPSSLLPVSIIEIVCFATGVALLKGISRLCGRGKIRNLGLAIRPGTVRDEARIAVSTYWNKGTDTCGVIVLITADLATGAKFANHRLACRTIC
jgi:hypothetical protein